MIGDDKIRAVPLGRSLLPLPIAATVADTEVGYDLGKNYQGWAVGNPVMFYARPRGVKGADRRMIEGRIERIERRWGSDFVLVRGRDEQRYDVKLADIEIADAVSRLGGLATD